VRILPVLILAALPVAAQITSLANRAVKYKVPAGHSVTLRRGPLTIDVADNEPSGAVHRKGYNGVSSLTHRRAPANLFVPDYSGLNLELFVDGTSRSREVFFEPRRAPMELRVVDKHTAELYQAPTPTWKLESVTRYRLERDGAIGMTFECIPRERTFGNGYMGFFWASYIQKPESPAIHFVGPRGWIDAVSPRHGEEATHLAATDTREFARSADFPSHFMVFSNSKHRYSEPFYYGVSHGMAFVLMFRPEDQVRFTQSPSGGGAGNPAWDFQWFVDGYETGKLYRLELKAACIPYESPEQVRRYVRRHGPKSRSKSSAR
jgi:hypothetical protein